MTKASPRAVCLRCSLGMPQRPPRERPSLRLGARFASLAQWQRMLFVVIAGALISVTHEGILWLILIIGVFRAVGTGSRECGRGWDGTFLRDPGIAVGTRSAGAVGGLANGRAPEGPPSG
jgi:hypothetical protein